MNYANDEKLRLLRWLLPDLQGNEIVAAELPFRDVGRKADLAVLSSSRLHVIEVKGPRDNLGKLQAQAGDYLQAFLTVDVALATRYLSQARELLPRTVGLLELTEESVVRRRMPANRKLLSKQGALAWLHSRDLQRLLGARARGLDIQTLRALADKEVSAAALTAAALSVAFTRSKERFTAFLSERSEILTLDDVAILQQPTRVR